MKTYYILELTSNMEIYQYVQVNAAWERDDLGSD